MTKRITKAKLRADMKKRPLIKPPHYCKTCGGQLTKVEIWDTVKHVDMGHVWLCHGCDERTIGYDDLDEYDGKPKPKGAKEVRK